MVGRAAPGKSAKTPFHAFRLAKKLSSKSLSKRWKIRLKGRRAVARGRSAVKRCACERSNMAMLARACHCQHMALHPPTCRCSTFTRNCQWSLYLALLASHLVLTLKPPLCRRVPYAWRCKQSAMALLLCLLAKLTLVVQRPFSNTAGGGRS